MNRFRLSSSDLFIRKEEGTEKPSRIVFLSVEGNSTEVDYLKHLNRNKERLGIKSWVEIEVLGRKPTDTRSDPDSVLELLEEFVSLYNKGLDENRINSLLPQGYSIDMVKQYVEDPDTLPQGLGSNLQERLNQSGIIDLAYYRYLINKKGEDDYFGIIIDRDSNSHPQQQAFLYQ